jgi:hypothetical protein
LRNHLTRRANQRHDAIIAARVTGGPLAEPIGTGAIEPHAQAEASDEAKEGKKMRRFGKVDIPQKLLLPRCRLRRAL